jgi:uncharacterized membrane protein
MLKRDEGSLMILIIGYAAIVATFIVVAIDVSTVFLARRSTVNVADGAALAAAQAVDRAAVYANGGAGLLPLSDVAADRAVAQYLADAGVRWQWSASVRGGVVTVMIRRLVRLPFVDVPGAVGRVTVAATAHAQTVVG